ncbi:probable polygalacturonase [Tanacetum coccineum]
MSGTTHINSPKLHMSIVDYEDVDIKYIKTVALGDSPNTDGIDVNASTRINIHDSNIQTGPEELIDDEYLEKQIASIEHASKYFRIFKEYVIKEGCLVEVRELEYEVQMVHLHCCSLAYIILTELESHVLKQRI